MPNNNHIAISKKIKEEEERNRLEEIVRDLKPENMGVIIRTAAQGKSIFHLKRDGISCKKMGRYREKKQVQPK